MRLSCRALARLILPAGLLLLAVALVFNLSVLDGGILPYLVYLPYPLLLVVALLSQQFNRGRSFAAGLLLLLAYGVIQYYLQSPLEEPPTQRVYTGLSLAVPLGMTVLLWLPERGLWNPFGLLVLISVPLVFAGLVLLGVTQPLWPGLESHWLQLWPWSGYVLSPAATGLFAVAALVGLLCLHRRDTQAEAALLGMLVALYLTLVFFYRPYISSLLCSVAALCLTVGLLRSSRDMAFRDELTGLRNRRAFEERLRGLGRRYVIATLDIDHFKRFNDTHGHDIGDEVLRMVAAHIDRVGGGGTVYRYGGEEFCIVFAGKSLEECEPHLEAVRESIADYPMAIRHRQTRPASPREGRARRGTRKSKPKIVQVTVSIGAAQRSEQHGQPAMVLKASDKALYRAKKKGRNRLEVVTV